MRDLTVRMLHQIVGGRLRMATLPPRAGEDTPLVHVNTDSRLVRRGEVFWGLAGSRFDGAAFAEQAFARGASGVVVGRYVRPWPGCWSLQVEDATAALVKLADWNRRRMQGPVVAITGSVGKTTSRQMVHAVLSTSLTGSASPKNFNNHVGLPLSMLTIEPDDQFAVLELAANASGEISRLAALCQPKFGVITRIGDAHLGGFGSIEALADAKAELLGALPAHGCAVLNGDDERLRHLASRCRARVMWFGRAVDNDLVATKVRCAHGQLSFAVDGREFSVGAWGRHHLCGALAAVAVGRLLGIEDAQIAEGLKRFQPPPMRCQIRKVGGVTIIDDTYNASPAAMTAALELLRDVEAPGRRIVVCGDMRELGDAAAQLHEQLGDEIVTVCGADLLLACGDHAHLVVAGARAAGMPRAAAVARRRVDEVLSDFPTELRPGDAVLVKGSRAMEMERLVAALVAEPQTCAA